MKIRDRIKYIRTDLHLSQEAFGESLGVSRDVINNMERGRPEAKDYMLKLICKTYRVNYIWLTEGIGDPYLASPDILSDEAIEKYHLKDNDKEIIERYIKLDPEKRELLKEIIVSIIKAPD